MKKLRPQVTPRKPTYPRQSPDELKRLAHVVKYGDELLNRAGFKNSTKKFNGGVSVGASEVPRWMDPITILWLRRGGEIPWEEIRNAIRAGMQGRLDEVEYFLFTWEDSDD